MSPEELKDRAGRKPEEGGDNGDFAQLLAESERSLTEGELIRGRVLQVTDDEVLVDIGFKSEGMIPRREFAHVPADQMPQPGQEIDAILEKTEDASGYVVLSYEKARRNKAWDAVEQAFQSGAPVRGRVLERVKGGLAVDIGVRAFLPGSLADTRPLKNLDVLRGRELDFRVVGLDKKRGNIVLSRKAVLEELADARKKEAAAALAEGRTMKGVVKNLTEYGAFVDLGGIDGLLHITDMSWGRLAHPSDAVKVGQEVEVKVLKFDPESGRISLGMKQLKPDPWHDLPAHYPVGARVRGTVVSLTDYGAFVELEEGIEGLIHVSEMSWTKKVKNPSKILTIGEVVEAVISDVNVEQRRLSLSLRATEPNPWEALAEKYRIGDRVEGVVRNLTDFGAFVEIEEGIDGLVHVSDMSWGRRVKHASEVLKKGDKIQAVLTAIDVENRRISLSIKEFRPNEWEEFASEHHPGEVVSGTVAKVADFGVFVRLPGGLEGLMHISETNLPRGRKLSEFYHPDDPIRVRILRIEVDEQRIGLSSRDVPEEEPHAPEAEASGAEAAGEEEPTAPAEEAAGEAHGEDEAGAKEPAAEPSE
ncbi:MAG: 30S ribosomal protein S1 [Acidobacteria bacterium]|nr:MAG: 30S ribosomal protein S1 [Acidobacteriota bacterium]MCE7959076.1 30S ribosomal protein S1 [Acidobacteria bacterium ACB2]